MLWLACVCGDGFILVGYCWGAGKRSKGVIIGAVGWPFFLSRFKGTAFQRALECMPRLRCEGCMREHRHRGAPQALLKAIESMLHH